MSREFAFKHDFSEKVDKVLTQRLLGPAIMLGVLFSLFWVTFHLGEYPHEWMLTGFGFPCSARKHVY